MHCSTDHRNWVGGKFWATFCFRPGRRELDVGNDPESSFFVREKPLATFKIVSESSDHGGDTESDMDPDRQRDLATSKKVMFRVGQQEESEAETAEAKTDIDDQLADCKKKKRRGYA